jgi:hypothetical protein
MNMLVKTAAGMQPERFTGGAEREDDLEDVYVPF